MWRGVTSIAALCLVMFAFLMVGALVTSRQGAALDRANTLFPTSNTPAAVVSTTKIDFRWLGGLISPNQPIFAVAFSPDGRRIVTAGQGTEITLWDAATLEKQAVISIKPTTIRQIAFSTDGEMIAGTSTDATIRIWDADDGKLMATFQLPSSIRSLEFSLDSQTLATQTAAGTVWLWDIASSTRRYSSNGVSFGPYGAAFTIIDPTAQLWDFASNNRLAVNRKKGLRIVRLSPDGRLAAASGTDHSTSLTDLATGRQFTLMNPLGNPRNMAFSPDGTMLALADDDGKTRLWNTTNGTLGATLFTIAAYDNCPVFSPDSSVLATCWDDGAVRLWGLNGR